MPPESREERAPVAVIAVHGVADQQRCATVDAVASLLASQLQGALQREDRLLQVEKVYACERHQRWPDGGFWARVHMARKQSIRSDFIREVKARGFGRGAPKTTFDLGGLYTDYLLFKANGRRRVDGDRHSADAGEAKLARIAETRSDYAKVATVKLRAERVRADLFELYWADLSRVSSGFLRVLSELATLLVPAGAARHRSAELGCRRVELAPDQAAGQGAAAGRVGVIALDRAGGVTAHRLLGAAARRTHHRAARRARVDRRFVVVGARRRLRVGLPLLVALAD
jgi:hypothetical protein